MKSLSNRSYHFDSDLFKSLLLVFCTVSALFISNSSYREIYNKFIFSNTIFNLPFNTFINDFLMFFFFLNVGLEIKENILYGNLSSVKKAAFPVIASIGGVVAPAIIFFLFNMNTDFKNGFCIPISTDIAFAIGIFCIFKNYINKEARLFLLTLAVVDDLISILVIAILFTSDINLAFLFISLLVLFILIIANKIFHVESIFYYIISGLILWYFIKLSNIHPTISGILLAITIPSRPYSKNKSVLETIQNKLNYLTNFIIIPLFAFVNSGVSLKLSPNFYELRSLYFGILIGLSIGKPLGITSFTYFFSRLKLVKLPDKLDFYSVFISSLIAGIGFTMSIFMCELTFSYNIELIDTCKLAIITASLVSIFLTCFFVHSLE